MKHGLDRIAEPVEPIEQPVGRHDLVEIALRDVAPFVAAAEAVDDDEVGAAGFVQVRPRAPSR